MYGKGAWGKKGGKQGKGGSMQQETDGLNQSPDDGMDDSMFGLMDGMDDGMDGCMDGGWGMEGCMGAGMGWGGGMKGMKGMKGGAGGGFGMKGNAMAGKGMKGFDSGMKGGYGMGGCGPYGNAMKGGFGMGGGCMKGAFMQKGCGRGAAMQKGAYGMSGGGALGSMGNPIRGAAASAGMLKQPARPAAAAAPVAKTKPAAVRVPPCHWICAPADEKVPPIEAPLIHHDKSFDIFSSAGHIIQDVCGSGINSVKIDHDPEWENYPEVGKAVADALGEENCFAVAFYEPKGVWAVGAAAGTQGRERAVKIALAVAIASEDAAIAGKLHRHYPGFWKLCEAKLGDYDPANIPAMPAEQGKAVAKPGQPPSAWIVMPEDAGLSENITAPEGFALMHDKTCDIFSSSHHILQEIVDPAHIKFAHDPDCNQFNSISAACGQAFDEESGLVVATHEEKGIWAVGVAPGKQGRERAGKLAIAVALAAEDPGTAAKLEKNYPGFWGLCEEKLGAFDPANIPAPLSAASASAAQSLGVPAVHMLQLPATGAFALEGLPVEGPAIPYQKDLKDCFSEAHHILCEFVEDPSSIEVRDDIDWKVMPEIGEAIHASGAEESSYCVAIDPTKSCWGVGISMGKKTRLPAAKLALALAMAQLSGRIEEVSQTWPDFGQMCSAAGLVELSAGGAPAKKLRAGNSPALM